jgi:hypothetical protein
VALKKKFERKARYSFLWSTEKHYVDHMKAEYLLDALERGNVAAFTHYVALIQDYVEVYPEAKISKDWQEILELPYTIYNAAIGRNNPPPINNEKQKSTIDSFERAYKKE